jgi:DNA-binding NarL/FixJ family response regulator
VLKLIIIEDEPQLALTIKQLVELNPRYKVAGFADDLASAIAAADQHRPDLALVDLQLANATSGFNVASKLQDRGIVCLFVTGTVPSFPLPDLAVGCLAKPFREDDLVRALAEAEDVVRGRAKLVLRESLPPQLQLYTRLPPPRPKPDWSLPAPTRPSWRDRLLHLIRRPAARRTAAPL